MYLVVLVVKVDGRDVVVFKIGISRDTNGSRETMSDIVRDVGYRCASQVAARSACAGRPR